MNDIIKALKPHMTYLGMHLLVSVAAAGVMVERFVSILIKIPFLILSSMIILIDCFVVYYFMPDKQEENAEMLRDIERKKLVKEIWKK